MQLINVTAENIEEAKSACPALDQRAEFEPGCQTWGISYGGGQRGQMTRWPSGRGAVGFVGDSLWGDWSGDTLILDDGGTVSQDGELESGE